MADGRKSGTTIEDYDATETGPDERRLWSDDELRIAVDAYFYIASLRQSGIELSAKQLSSLFASIPLPNRNDASIRYRFRNISYVVTKLGLNHLEGFSPAQKLGSEVERRIVSIIRSRPPETLRNANEVETPTSNLSVSLRQISDKLELLDAALSELEEFRNHGRIGHNNPPEFMMPEPNDLPDFAPAHRELEKLGTAVNSDQGKVVGTKSFDVILDLGLQLSIWLGKRFTKFTDAALVTLAPIVVAKVTNVMPLIFDTLKYLFRFFVS